MKKLACLALLALSWNAIAGDLGDFAPSTNVCGKFTTFQPSTGTAFALAGTPALSVYKDDSTTQSTTGVTLTASFDSVAGLNHYCIDTSEDGTFYSAGSNFDVVITTGTVDSVSVVGAVVGSFSLSKTAAKADTAAILVDTGTSGVLISSGTGSGQLSITSGVALANTVAVSGDTNAADMLETILDLGQAGWGIKSSGTAQAYTAATPSITLASGETYGDNTLTGNTIFIRGSTQGYWQQALIASNVGTSDIATLDAALAVEATGTVDYIIFGTAAVSGSGGGGDATEAKQDAIKAVVDSILVDTAEIGTAGAGLTNIDLPNQTMNITGSITGNLSGSVGSVTGAVGSVTGNVGGNVAGSVGSVATGGITAASIDNGAIDAATFAADVDAEILSYIVDDATRIDASALNTATGTSIPAILVDTSTTLDDMVDDLETRLTSTRAGYLDNLSAGAVATASALATADGNIGTILVTTDKLDDTLELDSTTYRFTVNALEQAPVGGGGGTTDWTADERTAIASILGIPGSGTTPADPSAGILDAIRDYVDTEVAEILTRVPDASPGADGGLPTVDASNRIAGIQGTITTLDALDTAQDAQHTVTMNRLGAPAGASMSADIAAAKADSAAILIDTAEIGVAGAGLTAVPYNSAWSASIRSAIGLATANLDTQVSGIPLAVWSTDIEDQGGGVEARCALAALLATVIGDVSTTDGTSTFEDPSGTETRAVSVVVSSGNRTATITCPSY